MQNVHADLLNKEFKIKSNDISEFTTAQIQAKAAAMGLTDSLTTELIAMGKNAAFTQKAATGKLTFGKALKENIGSIEEIADVLSKSSVLPKDDLEPLIIPEIELKPRSFLLFWLPFISTIGATIYSPPTITINYVRSCKNCCRTTLGTFWTFRYRQ